MKKEDISQRIAELEKECSELSNQLLEHLIELTKNRDINWIKIFTLYETADDKTISIFTNYIQEKLGEEFAIIKKQSYYDYHNSGYDFCLLFRDLETNNKIIVVAFLEQKDTEIVELDASIVELPYRLYNAVKFLTDDEESDHRELEEKLAAINNFLSDN